MPHLAITTNRSPGSDSPLVDALLVGPWQQREFRQLAQVVPHFGAYPCVETIAEARDFLAQCEVAPELLFLAQPLPGLVQQADIDRLQQLVPLARIVVVVGTWCEGGLRTDATATGVLRLYWYELAPWWQAAMRRLAAGKCPSWSLPLDHLQAGRYSSDSKLAELTQMVAIYAEDYAVFETLAESIAMAGAMPLWANRNEFEQAQAGIFDGGQLDARQLDRLREFCSQIESNVTLLLDYPREDHIALARAAGATAVFGKPYVVEEVLASLV